MTYKKIGTIDNISEIPFGKNLVVTGAIGTRWMWQMPGIFLKQDKNIIFRDQIIDVASKIHVDTKINLNILEKI